MAESRFDPEAYEATVAQEIPSYDRLQDEVAAAANRPGVKRILDLGVGTGATSARVLRRHPSARLVGLDESEKMLAAARLRLPADADLRVGALEGELPKGPFDLVVSALAVHHLDGAAKADLFRRVAAVLTPDGRFVLGDLIVPEDPADVVTPIDGVFDQPSRLADQLAWLAEAGLAARAAWTERDLAVIIADRQTAP
ncbi:MAG: class I SAM-dependent methyltransferase [Caulobacteraceae bacterium]